VRIFAYFGVCNGFVTKTKHDLTRPQNSCKTWRSRKSGNQKTTRGNTMENVTISKKTLETLLENTINMHEYDGLDLTVESDRKLAIMVQEAVEAIDGYQEQLEEKARIEAIAEHKRWIARQEAKAIEDQKAEAKKKAEAKAAKAAK
tara:strand:+ start:110 stop:547 length:438 start_codon:yes stop_codon:yes gene_type:complete